MNVTNTSDRSLSITRLLNAPRELVWEVWTKPEHIAKWWGPNGFSLTTSKMEVKEKGEWNFVMHGPDGTDYRNEIVYVELKRPELLVYDHPIGPKFRATVTFEAVGDKTNLTMTMVFETAESLQQTIKTFNAAEGQKQTIGRLEDYLSKLQ